MNNIFLTNRYLRALIAWICIFWIFVPYGYFPWFYAVPMSIFSFVFLARWLVVTYEFEQLKKRGQKA
jgi:hypothetical protein